MPTRRNSPETMKFALFLGRTIRVARRLQQMKAYAVCQDVGITEQTLSMIENGRIVPTLQTLMDLSKVLNRNAWELLRAAEKMYRSDEIMLRDKREGDDEP